MGNVSRNQAKYSYFTRLIAIGLVFSFSVITLGAPRPAEASVLSYLKGLATKIATPAEVSSEPQNSQNITFLEAATNTDPSPAKGGGDIVIVDDSALLSEVGPSGSLAEIEANNRLGKVSLYVVRSGDTLPQIAKMYNVSVNTILWANDLEKGATLHNGQTLIILPVSGVEHIVKKGDTLKGIAKKYKADVQDIADFNDIGLNEQLSVGDMVIVPDGEEVSISSGSTTPKSPSSGVSTSRARIIASYPSVQGYYANPLPTGRKSQGIHGFNGVDLAAPKGDTILAAAEGTVIVSKFRPDGDPWFGGYGNYVMIQHPNGTQTLYGHMSAVYVSMGAHVDQGQPIGEVGSTGKSTGPHLHFEVRGAKNPF